MRFISGMQGRFDIYIAITVINYINKINIMVVAIDIENIQEAFMIQSEKMFIEGKC